MRILVTGSAGSIGSELVRQLAFENRIYCLDNNDTVNFDLIEELKLKGCEIEGRVGDIRDKETIDKIFSSFKPQMVYHAAALKVVTSAEWTPMEYVNTNISGTNNLIEACQKYGVKKLVNISTDKVIHGTSVMGATKRVAELMVKNAGHVSVRFGNVMGSRGSVLPLWQSQWDKGEPLTVTDERMERYMMTIPQAVSLVIEAGRKGRAGEIWILDMGKPIKILDLAKNIIENTGKGSIKMIGIRPGEMLSERLMTDEEEKRATKKDNFYVL